MTSQEYPPLSSARLAALAKLRYLPHKGGEEWR